MSQEKIPATRVAPSRTTCAAALVTALIAAGCTNNGEAVFGPTPTTTATGQGGAAAGGSGGSGAGSMGGNGGSGGSGGAPIVCPTDPRAPGEYQLTIQFEGHQRQYDLQVPLSYDNTSAVPLLFDIHGYSSNKDQQQLVSGFQAKAEEEGFAVVRPNGFGLLARSWNGGDFCCGDAHSAGLDDVGLMKAIAAEVSQQLCIDPRRIYATGISNGGALSHRIACEAGDVFAAVAPVSYPLDFDPFDRCQPLRPMPVIHQHGIHDAVVPYGGNLTAPATPDSFAYWAQANGCTDTPEVTYQNDNSVCETYDSCSADVKVTLCSIDGGHVLYVNNDAVPVADIAWQFLSAYTLPP